MFLVIDDNADLDEIVSSKYFDDYAWLINYTSVKKLEDALMGYTIFGFNPHTQWRFLSVTKSLTSPAMTMFRHLFGIDATLVLAGQGFYIGLLLISIISFSFLQFTIYLADYQFESTSTPLLICTLVNFALFFIGSHFYGRWDGQLPAQAYNAGRWAKDKLPLATISLLVFVYFLLCGFAAGAWALFLWGITYWHDKTIAEEFVVTGVFGGVHFLFFKYLWEILSEQFSLNIIFHSPKRAIRLLNYFKLGGDSILMVAYPVYYFWARMYLLDLDSSTVENEFRFYVYGFIAISYGLRSISWVIKTYIR